MIDLATTTKTYLRADEVMAIFGVRSRRTLYNWIHLHHFPAVQIGTSTWFPVDALRTFVKPKPGRRHPRRDDSVQLSAISR
jgi:predicted DNA-binding transcriptional regulator AlpA